MGKGARNGWRDRLSGGACRGSCLRSFPTCWSSNSLYDSLSPRLYICVLLDVYVCEDQYDFYTRKVRMLLESKPVLTSLQECLKLRLSFNFKVEISFR